MPSARIGASQIAGLYKRSSSKYHNQKVEVDGIKFDSKHEAERWCELKLLEKKHEILYLQRQVSFELIPKQLDERGKVIERAVKYVADFVYLDHDGNLVVEDAKSPITRTDAYLLKRKMMLKYKGIRIKEV